VAGRFAEGVQAQRHVRLGQFVQVVVQGLQESRRLGAHAGFVPADIRQH